MQAEPLKVRKATLARMLKKAKPSLQFSEHIAVPGDIVLRHDMRARTRTDRFKATGVTLRLGSFARLGQGQESRCASGAARV
jgi:hypothetical protein